MAATFLAASYRVGDDALCKFDCTLESFPYIKLIIMNLGIRDLPTDCPQPGRTARARPKDKHCLPERILKAPAQD